ncbi:Na(+)/H(+) antiporter subunit D [Sneathiella glossodoripedis]|uniref:Na(+)/H(+) antiporter subunit D n=1 Tax=Sneathiella glossodoripedis TaxID=418853 RepID=UPI00047253F0|nr:Na(+)/H(+) antiporter subunit D [Sneathiella glossodoripedis]
MIEGLNPGIILILGALLVPLTSGVIRNIYLLLLPILGLSQMISLGLGSWGEIEVLGIALTLTKIDAFSRVFGLIFHIAAFAGILYALHVRDTIQQVATLLYAGASIAAVFSGDLISLFSYWELTAISSVFLIFASRTERSYNAGMRYLLIQVSSGVILLAGVILYYADQGHVNFGALELDSLAAWLFLIAFGIKAGFPLLNNWIQDAYPQATVTGTVILSAFTTKLAIYALARSFAGEDILLWIGAIMVIFPVFHATLENDLRKTMAYSLNSQQGFMVIAIGIGSELALNGVAAHATISVLYTCLVFMGTGAVLYRNGTAKITELGAVYKSMPVTTFFVIIGSLTIIAFPLTGAFATKSLILSASLDMKLVLLWCVMLFGAVAVIDNVGLKIPALGFFKKDDGRRTKEAPFHMLAAMGLLSACAIWIGLFPAKFFALLPYEMDYHVYTASHVVTQLQLIIFAALGFALALRLGVYPAISNSSYLDTDWLYRRLTKKWTIKISEWVSLVWAFVIKTGLNLVDRIIEISRQTHGISGTMGRGFSSAVSVFLILFILSIFTLIFYGS